MRSLSAPPCIKPCIFAAELRLAFRPHDLELTGAGAPRGQQVMLERAFKIVGQPELRVWYETLADPDAPTVSGMEDLALFWLQESLRVTVYPSMLAASSRFHPSCGVDVLVRHFGAVSFKTTGLGAWNVRRKLTF